MINLDEHPPTPVYRGDDGFLYRMSDDAEVGCAMFAQCENMAVDVVQHPVLRGVPSCQRCKEKLA